MLETSRLYLKEIAEQDEQEIVKWRNQKFVLDRLINGKGVSLAEHRSWFQNYLNSNSRMELMISKKEDHKKIGTIGLSNIDNINLKAEYGILIGEQDEAGKGYAQEASQALLKYGFQQLNLNKIYLRVFSDNYQAIKLYRKLGLLEEGLLKQEISKNGEFKDLIIMAILKAEWKSACD